MKIVVVYGIKSGELRLKVSFNDIYDRIEWAMSTYSTVAL